MKKHFIFAALFVGALICGCGKSDSAATNTGPSQDPVRASMDAKLKAMTPEERAKYVQEHPDEISAAYSGVPTPGK